MGLGFGYGCVRVRGSRGSSGSRWWDRAASSIVSADLVSARARFRDRVRDTVRSRGRIRVRVWVRTTLRSWVRVVSADRR